MSGLRIEPGLVSVIVPCLGPSAGVRRCLAALFRHTKRPPWELVAVRRAGDSATEAYLAGLRDASSVPVTIVAEPELKRTLTARRLGLSAARGEFVAFLSPATVVTDAWLEQLHALIRSGPDVALAGPTTNAAPGPQRSGTAPGSDDPGEIDAFAARWRAERRGRWFWADALDGSCLLARRSLLDGAEGTRPVRAEGLRSRRLFLRARRLGGRAAVAHDLYVHRAEGRPARPGSIAAKAEPPARRCRVSLTMIVRDEEANLPACLGSAKDLFDEIVVVDTGSTDRTVEIARSFGARVFDFVWVDDFAAARNAALARATGDYVFWLDADDVIDPPERAKLFGLLAGLRPGDEAAHVIRCSCDPGPNGDGGRTVVDHVRLFPRREDVRWTYRVHEQILPSLRRAGVPVRWTDATVRHTGYVDAELRDRKLGRDAAILQAEAEERPDDPFVRFNLGAIAVERGEWGTALEHLRRSLARSAPSDSITRKLHALIARVHQQSGEPEEALRACRTGLADDPDDAELLFREGVLHRRLGDPERAEACWRRVLTLRRPELFSSVDQGIYGHLPRRNLALLARERGDRDEEVRLWTAVLAECPGDPEAAARLEESARPVGDGSGGVPWLIPGSRRFLVPRRGEAPFDPYAPRASDWIERLGAKVVVALGPSTEGVVRALLAGARAVDGRVWGVDPEIPQDVRDPRYVSVRVDAAATVDRWAAVDLLHLEAEPREGGRTRLRLALYGPKCRAIALHGTHRPDLDAGPAAREFAAGGGWRVHEYLGDPSGWTVLTREGDPAFDPDAPR